MKERNTTAKEKEMVETAGMKNWKGLRVYGAGFSKSYIYQRKDGSCGLSDAGDLCASDKAKMAKVAQSFVWADLLAEIEQNNTKTSDDIKREELKEVVAAARKARKAKKATKTLVGTLNFYKGETFFGSFKIFDTDLNGLSLEEKAEQVLKVRKTMTPELTMKVVVA